MTREEAIKEINRVFEPAFANYIIIALTEGATPSDKALKQEPCDDCISRQATVKRLCKVADFMNEKRRGLGSPYIMAALFIQDNKDEFPSVTPKEKTGHWIVDWSATSRLNRDRSLTYEYRVHCDRCGYRWDYTTDKKGSLVSNYCPNCGARMVESEDKK